MRARLFGATAVPVARYAACVTAPVCYGHAAEWATGTVVQSDDLVCLLRHHPVGV